MTASIHIVILAAGSASRFGSPKLAASLNGRPLLQHALRAARDSGLGELWLVTGSDEVAILHAADGLADFVVRNPDFGDGMGTSIAAGVAACRSDADAVLVMLGDQPGIDATHLRALAQAWSGSGDEIVASAFGDTAAPPVLFGTATFDALAALRGDTGAKRLFSDTRFQLQTVPCAAAAIDVDEPADLAALMTSQSAEK